MKKIPLTQGKYALVDDEDYEYLNQWKWSTDKFGNTFCARRGIWNKKTKSIHQLRMHRLITKAPTGKDVDHINGNGLDNQRKNLRVCNHKDNSRSCRIPKNNTSGYKGVHWHKKHKKWTVGITVNKKRVWIGQYSNIKDAIQSYIQASKKYFGEFSRIK